MEGCNLLLPSLLKKQVTCFSGRIEYGYSSAPTFDLGALSELTKNFDFQSMPSIPQNFRLSSSTKYSFLEELGVMEFCH